MDTRVAYCSLCGVMKSLMRCSAGVLRTGVSVVNSVG